MSFSRTAAVAGVGTVSCTGTTTVTGVGTTFATLTGAAAAPNSARVGGTITVGGVTKTIVAITSATSLTTDTAFGTFTSLAFTVQTGVDQTGTDTMNNSMGSIAGFTFSNRGDLFRTFDCQGNDLTIRGTLTVESVTAQIRNDGSCNNTFKVIGSVSGGEIIFKGQKATSSNAPFPYPGFDWLGTNGLKIMSLEGTATYPAKFRLIDACVRFGADWLTTYLGQYSIVSTSGAICWFLCAKGTGTSQGRLRQDNATASIDFQATKTYMGVWLNMGVPQTSLKGYTPIDTDGPEVNVNMVTVATRIPIENYNTTYVNAAYYTGTQIVLYGGAWVRLKNNLLGTNIVWKSQSPNNRNVLEFSKQVKATAKDSLGNLLSDGYFYFTPAGANVAGIRAKGGTTDITFDLSKKTLPLVSGMAETEFVYAWDYANSVVNESTYEYFCSGVTKGAETHTGYVSRYGYDTQAVTLALSGNDTYQVTTVHASLPTTDKVIANAGAITGVTFDFPAKTWANALGSTRTVQEIYDSYQYQRNQPSNLGVVDDCTVVNGLFNWVGWTGVNNGTITAGVSGYQIGASTLTNNGLITAIYYSGGQSSSTLRLQSVSAAGVAGVWHSSTMATELFQTNNSGSVTSYEVYYPPGSVGLVKNYARELYGLQRSAGSITLAAGLNTVSFVDIPDVGITQSVLANVLAYTSLETPSKFYDRTAAFRLTEPGIKLGQIATRSGTSIEIGAFSHLINQSAAAVYSILGSVITTKSTSYEPDSKYTKEIALPPATITAASTEIITISLEDANGDSQAVVAGTSNSLVDVWKITNSTPVAEFATGTKIGSNIGNGAFRWIGLSGFKLVFNNKDNGVYRYCSMSKGDYTVGWYLYDVPTGGLTQEQSDVLNNINLKTADTFNDINSVTQGFVESTDSLHALRLAVDAKPTLAQVEASTVLAMKADVLTRLAASAYTAPDNASILAAKDNSDLIPILLAK